MLHYTLGSAQNLRPVLTILAIKKTPAGTLAKGKDNQTMPSAGQELLVLSKAALKETRLLITFKIQQRSNKYFHVVFFPFQTLFKTILL